MLKIRIIFTNEKVKLWFKVILSLGLIIAVTSVFAETFGTVAQKTTKTFTNIAKLITATSYIAGLGFAIGAILKFKQHKDNPTQIPVGTPVALVFIAAALIFLPSIFQTVGHTLFTSPETGTAKGKIKIMDGS